ncbi:MAG: hypothetical protein M0R03_07355 [Novosphingobium sp.]|nr:hypothetical protein [Novosphingobium sp.]
MPGYVLIIDFFGLMAALIGFTMAFRQDVVRHMIGRPPAPGPNNGEGDPLTYILRIAGTMVMVFGVVIAGMVTLFNLA